MHKQRQSKGRKPGTVRTTHQAASQLAGQLHTVCTYTFRDAYSKTRVHASEDRHTYPSLIILFPIYSTHCGYLCASSQVAPSIICYHGNPAILPENQRLACKRYGLHQIGATKKNVKQTAGYDFFLDAHACLPAPAFCKRASLKAKE